MSDYGLSTPEGFVALNPSLQILTSHYGNVDISNMTLEDAVARILSQLYTEKAKGDWCQHSENTAEPICACAFQLACLLDMPGETLLEPRMFAHAITLLSQHPNEDIATEAEKVLRHINA